MPGPVPKPADQRARRNKDSQVVRVVELVPLEVLPSLPETFNVEDKNGARTLPFPAETINWFQNWVESPFSRDFDALAWERVRMAAVLHARAQYGDMKAFSEFRLHMALFPETPADRLRQRIQVAQAVDAEVTATTKVMRSVDRFANVSVKSMDPDVAS